MALESLFDAYQRLNAGQIFMKKYPVAEMTMTEVTVRSAPRFIRYEGLKPSPTGMARTAVGIINAVLYAAISV